MWLALANQETSRQRHLADFRFTNEKVWGIRVSDNQLDWYFQFVKDMLLEKLFYSDPPLWHSKPTQLFVLNLKSVSNIAGDLFPVSPEQVTYCVYFNIFQSYQDIQPSDQQPDNYGMFVSLWVCFLVWNRYSHNSGWNVYHHLLCK